MDRYIHHVPGRLRVRYDVLKASPLHADSVRRTLAALPGVEACTVNTSTGSVLCRYDRSQTKVEPLVAALEHAVCAPTPILLASPPARRAVLAKPPRNLSRNPMVPLGRVIGQKIGSYILEQSLERAFVLLLRAAL